MILSTSVYRIEVDSIRAWIVRRVYDRNHGYIRLLIANEVELDFGERHFTSVPAPLSIYKTHDQTTLISFRGDSRERGIVKTHESMLKVAHGILTQTAMGLGTLGFVKHVTAHVQ